MSDPMLKYSQQLRRLIDDYYHQQLSADEYRAQRKLIFDQLESEMTGRSSSSETAKVTSLDESTSHI